MPLAFYRNTGVVNFYEAQEEEGSHLLSVKPEFIEGVKQFVKHGEKDAIHTRQLLKLMGKKDIDINRQQVRFAVGYWVQRYMFVGSTSSGYFIPTTELERQRCIAHKQKPLPAIHRYVAIFKVLPLGKNFPK